MGAAQCRRSESPGTDGCHERDSVSPRRTLAQEDLLGQWYSLYQEETSREWVSEKVTIGVRGSRFRLTNSENPIRDFYEGFLLPSKKAS